MPRGTTLARQTTAHATTMAPGKVIGEYQQISGNVRWQIQDDGMVSLLYQPFAFGKLTDWQPVALDPVVQFAVYSLLQECGKLSGLTDGLAATNGATQTTITPQQRASQAAATARRQRAQQKLVNQSSG